MAVSFTEAWDEWNDNMMEVWGRESNNIEVAAIATIGDESIDSIFDRIAQVTGLKIVTLTLCIVLVFSTVVLAKNIESKINRAQVYECIDPFPQDGTTRK